MSRSEPLKNVGRRTDQENMQQMGRRRLLLGVLGCAGAATGASIILPATAFGAPSEPLRTAPVTLWRLCPTWASSSCTCSACRTHAANKVFFSSAAALARRAHPGCTCPAEPVAVNVDLAALHAVSKDGASVDLRHPEVAALLETPLKEGHPL